MGTELNNRLLLMKEEFDLTGNRFNGLSWQRIERHLQEYATECVKASLEKASKNAESYFDTDDESHVDKSTITSPDNIVLL